MSETQIKEINGQPTSPGTYYFKGHLKTADVDGVVREWRQAIVYTGAVGLRSEVMGFVGNLNQFSGAWGVSTPEDKKSHSSGEYYAKEYRGGMLDVYRILTVYGITHPAHQHAIKKLLRAGNKKTQPLINDVQEAIDILERWKSMIKEDAESGDSNSNDCNQAVPTI